jgi:hypothetical protein
MPRAGDQPAPAPHVAPADEPRHATLVKELLRSMV